MPDSAPVADTTPMLLREDRDAVAVLTLNRPNSRNDLSEAMLGALAAALDEIAADDAVRAVVIQGEGKALSAGHDLKEIAANRSRAYYEKLTIMMASGTPPDIFILQTSWLPEFLKKRKKILVIAAAAVLLIAVAMPFADFFQFIRVCKTEFSCAPDSDGFEVL